MKKNFSINTVLLTIFTVVIALGLPISAFGKIPRRSAPPKKQPKPPAESPLPPAESPLPPAESPLPLRVAAGVVQQAVAQYQKNADPLLKLESAEFDFKVQTEWVEGVGFGIPMLFTIGASRTEGHTADVTFTYSIPKPKPPTSSTAPRPPGADHSFTMTMTDVSAMDINTLADTNIYTFANALAAGTTTPQVDVKKFRDELLKAITDAAKTVKDVPPIGGANFEKFAITIEYSVKYEGKGSGNIPIFSFLTVTPTLGGNLNSVHSVKLVFPKAATLSPQVRQSQSPLK